MVEKNWGVGGTFGHYVDERVDWGCGCGLRIRVGSRVEQDDRRRMVNESEHDKHHTHLVPLQPDASASWIRRQSGTQRPEAEVNEDDQDKYQTPLQPDTSASWIRRQSSSALSSADLSIAAGSEG